jgi:class 3 adenylate cyclase
MINPVQTTIPQPDGTDRQVIIEPLLHKDSDRCLQPTGVYKIYKDAFGDETHLFTELAEFGEVNDDLPDEQNPDYLGKFVFSGGSVQHFEGQVLSVAEQAYLAIFIEDYREPDIDGTLNL